MSSNDPATPSKEISTINQRNQPSAPNSLVKGSENIAASLSCQMLTPEKTSSPIPASRKLGNRSTLSTPERRKTPDKNNASAGPLSSTQKISSYFSPAKSPTPTRSRQETPTRNRQEIPTRLSPISPQLGKTEGLGGTKPAIAPVPADRARFSSPIRLSSHTRHSFLAHMSHPPIPPPQNAGQESPAAVTTPECLAGSSAQCQGTRSARQLKFDGGEGSHSSSTSPSLNMATPSPLKRKKEASPGINRRRGKSLMESLQRREEDEENQVFQRIVSPSKGVRSLTAAENDAKVDYPLTERQKETFRSQKETDALLGIAVMRTPAFSGTPGI